MLSRQLFFARLHVTRPFKSRRMFNALNRAAVRVLVEDGPLSATPTSPTTAQTARPGRSVLICTRQPARVHLKWTPCSVNEVPAALHSSLNPERNFIGAVIRPRFASRVSVP